jgi:sugar O-acyltransferase (sialic acid O-acetyltransferase NeuD family)
MKKKIVLVGGGGHCKSVIDVIEMEGSYSIAGIIDIKEKLGLRILGYEICWTDEHIAELVKKYENFLITIGQIRNPDARITLYEKIKGLEGKMPVLVSPKAHVSRHATIGEGTVVMHHAVVNAEASVGKNNILNTGCLLEHDVEVGDHCHVSTKAVINGGTRIGDRVFVGSSSVLSQTISVGSDSVISSGSVVRKSIPAHAMAFGNPARIKLFDHEH